MASSPGLNINLFQCIYMWNQKEIFRYFKFKKPEDYL